MKYYEDPILGKGRAADVSGGTGSADYVGGTRIAIAGETISFVNSATIQNVTGNSVTLEPDTAYKIYATSQAITLNANPPAAGKWAYEGHLEIFVAGTGYVVTGTNVVLANALEPDAVNNCTVRFHDGIAIIAVEDHVAGYIVVNGSTSGDGSLYYGIATSTNDYVAFDASLNGATVSLSGSTANSEKHLVGNGYTSTTLTGAVDCGTSKFTVANLALSDVQITGGTMTLGDVYIPSGSTVAVSGGGLAVEKVVGAGSASVIDRGGTTAPSTYGMQSVNYENVTLRGGVASSTMGGGVYIYNTIGSITDCTFTQNSGAGGAILLNAPHSGTVIKGCVFSGNTNNYGGTIQGYYAAQSGDTFVLQDCNFGINEHVKCNNNFKVILSGSNTTLSDIVPLYDGRQFSVTLTSGAILDLTGNTNATPIAPGGGITFASGGATVLYSSGAVSGSYMMDNVTLPAGAKLTNTAVVNLGGSDVVISSGTTASASGCTLTSGAQTIIPKGANVTLDNCTVSGNANNISVASATLMLSNCTVSGNLGEGNAKDVSLAGGATATINGGIIGSVNGTGATKTYLAGTVQVDQVRGVGSVIISGGADVTLGSRMSPDGGITILEGGCVINGKTLAETTTPHTSIVSSGGQLYVDGTPV